MRKTMKKLTQGATRLLVLALGLGLTATGWGATPVAVWDGRHADYDFSSLTRGNFTLGNIGEGYVNSVASDGSYLQIGNQDAKAAITLKKTDSSAMGASTVIIRCENMQTDDNSNRAVLSFMNGTNPYVGIAQQRYLSHASAFIWDNGIWNNNVNVAVENAFSESGDNTIALAYSYANGSAYYVNGVLRCAAVGLRGSSYNPSEVVIGGVGADGSGSFYAMKGMKITAIAFFNGHISREDIASYMFPSETAEAYIATVSSSMSWSEIPWDGGKTWSGDTSSAKVNLVINSGATVTAPASLNATKLVVTGAGTLTFAEGENALSVKSAAINAKVDLPSGATLKTVGDVGFYSESNEFRYGSLLEVVSGTACATTYCSSYSGGFAGTITIDPDGTFTLLRTDTLKRDSNQVVINVYGIISFIGNRWTVQGETNHQINLYPGSKVVGVGDGNGVFDFENAGSSIIVHNTNKSGEIVSGGVATIDAPIKFRTANANTTINVASGTKLAMKKSQLGNGNIVKTGEGVLEFGVASSRPLTINGGSVVATAMPTGNVTINVDTTFTLKDVAWTSSDIFSGSGTLELLSTTDARTHTVTGSSFAGIVKLSNQNDKQCNLNPTGAATFTAAPELMLSANVVHLGAGYYRQQSGTHGPLEVRDLSGAGLFYAVWSSGAEYEYLVRTKQTKDTRFSGYVYSNTANNGNRRWVNLDVVGDGSGTVNSLTMDHGLWLQSTTDTSEQASTLSISNDAKVVFTSSGTWATGKVVVGEDGWLESANNAAVKNLTLQDGANLVFPTASSSLTGITNITFASGTTEVSFADGVTPTAGTLIDWSGALLESAPAGDFQLVGSVAGDWILTKSASGLSIAASAAKVTPTTGDPVAYASVALALSDYATLLGTDEGATMTILDGTTLTELDVIQLAQADIYYDSSSGVLTKAVAKVGQTCYPSLSAAISDGAAVTLLRNSSEAITLNVAVTLTETAAYSGTLSGSGTLTLSALRSSALNLGEWTGTVVLPQVNGTADGFRFDYYGKSGSTIAITEGFSGWINTSTADAYQIKAGIWIDNDSPVTINGTNSGTWYQIAKLSGGGDFSLIQSYAPAGFHILVLEDYSGTLSNTIGSGTPTALTVSRLNLAAAPVAGQRLINTTTPNAVNLESVYVGDAQQSVTLAKGSDGIYAALVSVTKGDNPTTYYATVSDAMTAAGSDAATITLLGNTDSNVSLAVGQSLVTGGFNVGTVSTGAEHCHVVNNAGVYTVALDQFVVTVPSVANTTVSVSYTSGGDSQVATAAGDIMVDYGTDVTATWTAASGYKITSGASQTLNAVTSAQTLASPTVEAMGATVSNVAVSYGADYASATVTATVSDTTLDYYISWAGGEPVKGSVSGSGSQVTFDVSGINHTTEYQSAGYTITAKDGETDVTTTGGSGTNVAADVVAAGWINENATTHGQQAAGGSWTNAEAVTYSEGKAAITDNRFEATSMSTSSRVILEFNVCFSSVSDANADGDAQGAIKLGEENSATTFMVLAQGGSWTAVSNDALTPDPAATYKVVMTFDYANNTYAASVNDYVLTNASGSANFPLAKSGATSVKNIDFAGSGTLTSMKGDQIEGYMVKDNAGHWYATIQAATQAYNSANGPYTVLHSGTAPSGWKIDGNTLIKLAKGFFFMAY